ncbi:unnamed protein product [Calypogeia fissa]
MEIEGRSVDKMAYVRLATKEDILVIKLLIDELAKFEKMSSEATESALESTLFEQPPFLGPIVLLLELGSPLSAAISQAQSRPTDFQEKSPEVSIYAPNFQDSLSGSCISSNEESQTVVGFVHIFPTYSSFLAKRGFQIGDLYVREAYRRQGLGRILLEAGAQQAAKRKLARVEWYVLEWNVNAIKFYQSMGAVLLQDLKVCRLSGNALENYA